MSRLTKEREQEIAETSGALLLEATDLYANSSPCLLSYQHIISVCRQQDELLSEIGAIREENMRLKANWREAATDAAYRTEEVEELREKTEKQSIFTDDDDDSMDEALISGILPGGQK